MEKLRSTVFLTRVTIVQLILLIVLLYLLIAVGVWASGLRNVVRCSDFKTQPDAQEKFDSNRSLYANLDKNHDGIACNNLPV